MRIPVMMTRALLVVAGLLGLSLPLLAQEADLASNDETITPRELRLNGTPDLAPALNLYQPDVFGTVDGTILIHSLPVLTLLDGRRFPISGELGRMGMAPLDLFPTAFLSSVEVQKDGSSPIYGSDAPGGVLNLHLNRTRVGGEAGVFYGKSGGKYGREDFQSYIVGTVGNDKVSITAGASYQESHFKVPRGQAFGASIPNY